MSLERHFELFVAQVDVLNEVGATIIDSAAIRSVAVSNRRAGAPTDDVDKVMQQT
jgi:hypothetical protein